MLQELLDDLETETPRGEYVILVEGWNEISAEEKEQKTGWREEAVSFALKMPLKKQQGKYLLNIIYLVEKCISTF